MIIKIFNRLFRYCSFLAISILITILSFSAIAEDKETPSSVPPLEFSETADDVIYYVPQFSDFEAISIQDMKFLKNVLKEAKENNAKAVIFELDTPGGRVDVALKYVSILSKSEVPTIAFVNPQGISAGMIIALAADRIAINPNGTIGDAMPITMTPDGVRPITERPPEDDQEKEEKPAEKPKEKPEEENKGKKGVKPEETPEKKKATGSDEAEVKKEEEKEDKKVEKEEKKPEEKKEKKKDDSTLKQILKEFEKMKKHENQNPEDKKLADQKFLTVFFKVLQVLAEKNNRPVKVIRAMADPYQKLSLKEDGIEHTKVSPLTLSAVEAKNLKVVDYICRNKTSLKDMLGLEDCKIEVKNKTATHFFILFLAHPDQSHCN